ncbi:hypothetical protein C2845_PM06G19750 [Panicum miliaceum]|uniref:PRA1 family protein n=1 Tax=Panicum miliaceum TaxID=4540 RepID=A0A3L6R869_PANMI|nr:hypothetical protein C2845_PM06G19750 [Panicum miliaceum]
MPDGRGQQENSGVMVVGGGRSAGEVVQFFQICEVAYSLGEKCVYGHIICYRTNYFILIMLILGMGFLWKPVAILAAFMTGLSIAFLNDSFAVTFNEKVTRTVRQFSPHLAAKMRPPITWVS